MLSINLNFGQLIDKVIDVIAIFECVRVFASPTLQIIMISVTKLLHSCSHVMSFKDRGAYSTVHNIGSALLCCSSFDAS